MQSINTLLDPVVNFGKVTVSTGYIYTDPVIVLTAGHGDKLPNPSIDGEFNLVWYNTSSYADSSDDPNVEIVRCTARSGDILTITRGQEGTIASNKDTPGSIYKMMITPTKKTIDDMQTDAQSKVDAHAGLTASHGVTGTIVGTTNSQELTNKTITDSTNIVTANSLKSATTTVDISSSPAPSIGQILIATSSTTATWQPVTSLSIPSGIISLWSGSILTIPSGWNICDGTNGTPDLRDRFIVGAGSTYAVAATGGEATHTLTIPEMPSHTHNALRKNIGADRVWESTGGGSDGYTSGPTGDGQAHENRPPYYALAYIMKL